MLGMITALSSGIFILGDKPMKLLFMTVYGAFCGWIYGMLWVFATGGF